MDNQLPAAIVCAAPTYVRTKCDKCRQSFKVTQWYFILVNGRVTDTICQACYIATASRCVWEKPGSEYEAPPL